MFEKALASIAKRYCQIAGARGLFLGELAAKAGIAGGIEHARDPAS